MTSALARRGGNEVEVASAAYARSLTDRIKVAVEGTWHLITEAYTSRAWSVLGYASWDDYCTREFGTSRLRLPREERQEIVSSLRDQGLSIRAIASVTGDSVGTVQAITSASSQQVFGSEHLGESATASATVTGLDGKTYSAPARTVHRKPLPDAAKAAGWDARRAVERIERLFDDNRYQQNAEQVAVALRGHLLYIAETMATVLDQLPQESGAAQ